MGVRSLALLGMCVMPGWRLQLAPVVRVLSGFTLMVFNTTSCFLVAGTLYRVRQRRRPYRQTLTYKRRRIVHSISSGLCWDFEAAEAVNQK
jgi:hypothetical protein